MALAEVLPQKGIVSRRLKNSKMARGIGSKRQSRAISPKSPLFLSSEESILSSDGYISMLNPPFYWNRGLLGL